MCEHSSVSCDCRLRETFLVDEYARLKEVSG